MIIGGNIEFSDLKIPFACVATDIMTGDEVVINQGSVLAAVRASISVPVIFTVAKWLDRYLVDGGLVNPVPVSILKKMEADFTIAVNVIPSFKAPVQHEKNFKGPNIFNALIQSIQIGTSLLVRSSLVGTDILIEPKVGHINPSEFRRAQDCIEQGELAAQAAIPEIKRKLET